MVSGSAGIILINEYMPSDMKFNTTQAVDSSAFRVHMQKFAKKYPQKFATNISKIADLGEKMAFYLGANVGPTDLVGDEKAAKKLINKLKVQLKSAKNDHAKREVLMRGLTEATTIAKSMPSSTNEMVQQVKSGSRGKPVQLARMSVGPIYAVDMNQLPKTTLIQNNFNSGLSSHEYFNVSSQGRFASVQAANATSEPGALGKTVVANTDDIKITKPDCHTLNGEFKSTADVHILGHFTAGLNGELITKKFLKKYKGTRIKVRTPITCAAHKGICAKCYGLKSNGRLPMVGEEVGIIAAQTTGEVFTQMTLSTKHSTMGKNDSTKLSGIEGFKIIANSPSSFKNAAVLSEVDGIVTGISKAPHGGTNITIGRKKYYASPTQKVLVRAGQRIENGDQLTSGILTPKSVMHTRGINEARRHESDTLHEIFKDSSGQDLMKKHFDVLARGHLSLSKDKFGDIKTHKEHGLMYPSSKQSNSVSMLIKGKYLAEDEGSISKGTKITSRIISKLQEWGIKKVMVTTEKPSFTPLFKSLEQRPIFTGNLFQKMNYRNIKNAIKDEVIIGKGSNIKHSHSSDRAKHTANML